MFHKAELNARYREVLMGIVADRYAIKKLTTREEIQKSSSTTAISLSIF